MSEQNIFVFGSNEAGIHSKGAAKTAKNKFGAIYGQGVGLQGNSYAIPTKDKNLRVLNLEIIAKYVQEFKDFAERNQDLDFYVTKVGTGLSRISDKLMVELFIDSPLNCIFDKDWEKYLRDEYSYFTGNL